MRLPLNRNPVDAQQLVGSPEPTVLLGGAQGNDGSDVDLIRHRGQAGTGWAVRPARPCRDP